ncbi:chitin binding-like protein [Trypanosoma cruzi cruzi]|nr:chitin binding-like protein [Trypanosoma cruzi cruzi]
MERHEGRTHTQDFCCGCFCEEGGRELAVCPLDSLRFWCWRSTAVDDVVSLRVPGRSAHGFLPSSCTCRRVPPAVDAATKDSPAVRDDVRWTVRGETTVKRLAAARVGVARCVLTRGVIPAVAFTAGGRRCVFPVHCSSIFCSVCLCACVVVVGSDCGGDDSATHCGWVAVLTVSLPFPLLYFFLTHKEGKEVRLNANRHCEIRRH